MLEAGSFVPNRCLPSSKTGADVELASPEKMNMRKPMVRITPRAIVMGFVRGCGRGAMAGLWKE